MKRLLLLTACAGLFLTGCQKDKLPTVTNEVLGAALVAELKAHPHAHCVRTSMVGFISDGATWLIQAADAAYVAQEVGVAFQNQLLTLQDKGVLRIQRFRDAEVGESWKVFYTPKARGWFGIPGAAPVRKDQVQQLCFGPQKATFLEREGPVELVNGVPRVQIAYRLAPVSLPKWAKDPELNDLLWARPPESLQSGQTLMYVDSAGAWQVDPTFRPKTPLPVTPP